MIIHESAKLAWELHLGQTRAGGQAFIYHPMRVAGLVSVFGNDGARLTEIMISAAWLHDVYEDTKLDPPMLSSIHPDIDKLVDELTNRFTKVNYPKWNRKRRKAAERDRISEISPEAQTIKLCDRIDNLGSIFDKKGRKFHKLYCDESEALADAIPVGPYLHDLLYSGIEQIRSQL